MVAADLVARTLFPSTEIPVGVVTGIVGAPYLLWLLARANRIGGPRRMTLRAEHLRLAYDEPRSSPTSR